MSNLTHEEKLVYDEIVACNGRITQLQLARRVFVGCHDRFEGYDNPKQSTLRKIRQIIRDLRMNHGLFILSDEEGYWVMKDKSEAKTYIERMERIAKATTKGYFDTFRAMQKAFGVTSEYFSKQGELFD
jgi:hypothetical protein